MKFSFAASRWIRRYLFANTIATGYKNISVTRFFKFERSTLNRGVTRLPYADSLYISINLRPSAVAFRKCKCNWKLAHLGRNSWFEVTSFCCYKVTRGSSTLQLSVARVWRSVPREETFVSSFRLGSPVKTGKRNVNRTPLSSFVYATYPALPSLP